MKDFLKLWPLVLLVAMILGPFWVFDKIIDWLDRKHERLKIKLGPWTIAKQIPQLGGKWVLWTRTHGHDLDDLMKIVMVVWPIFVFVAGLFIAYALTR
jgi:hypothetical protein